MMGIARIGLAVAAVLLVQGTATAADFITASEPFSPDGEVSSTEIRDGSSVRLSTIGTGTKDGVAYRFHYSDGSGAFAGTPGNVLDPRELRNTNWSIGCKTDIMDDSRSCHMQKGVLWVFAYSDGRRRVSVGPSDIYPGSSVSMRVDGAKPIRSPEGTEGFFGRDGSREAISQLRAGTTVATRYVDWPYGGNVDATMPLYGFAQAYEYLEWALLNSR